MAGAALQHSKDDDDRQPLLLNNTRDMIVAKLAQQGALLPLAA